MAMKVFGNIKPPTTRLREIWKNELSLASWLVKRYNHQAELKIYEVCGKVNLFLYWHKFNIARSSNGRTTAFEAVYLGSNPSRASKIFVDKNTYFYPLPQV